MTLDFNFADAFILFLAKADQKRTLSLSAFMWVCMHRKVAQPQLQTTAEECHPKRLSVRDA